MQKKLLEKSWTALYHNVRIARVQVDLLMRQPGGTLTLIEVKSETRAHMGHVGYAQMRRLRRVCMFLAQWEPIELQVALVQAGRVRLLPADALTAR